MKNASRAATCALVIALAVPISAVAGTDLSYRAANSHRIDRRSLAARPSETPPPPSGEALNSCFVGAATNKLAQFDTTIGYNANLLVTYINWGTPLPRSVSVDASRGVTTLLEILPQTLPSTASLAASVKAKPVSLESIALGDRDGYLKSLGASLKAIPHTVLLSFAPEMNGGWYPWGYGPVYTGPQHQVSFKLFLQAWRHVHKVITTESGATNVKWVWQISHEERDSTMLRSSLHLLWPGKSYVDIVGLDDYYYLKNSNFDDTLGSTISDVRKFTNLPLLLAETGIGPKVRIGVKTLVAGTVHEHYHYLFGAGQTLKNMNNLFKGLEINNFIGVVWFNHDESNGSRTVESTHQNWELGRQGAKNFRKALKGYLKSFPCTAGVGP
jgi:hypothetical protein